MVFYSAAFTMSSYNWYTFLSSCDDIEAINWINFIFISFLILNVIYDSIWYGFQVLLFGLIFRHLNFSVHYFSFLNLILAISISSQLIFPTSYSSRQICSTWFSQWEHLRFAIPTFFCNFWLLSSHIRDL